MINRRDYQTAALERSREAYDKGATRQLFELSTGLGKGQPLDGLVATPEGFRQMGDLSVGDLVIGSNGKPTKVTAVFDRGVLALFRVTMSDGTSLEVDGDHLWAVQSRARKHRGRGYVVRATRDLTCKDEYVPIVAPVEYARKELPIDPYVLGALIGDGGMTGDSVLFFSMDDDLVETCENRSGYTFREILGNSGLAKTYRIDSPKTGSKKELQTVLRSLGLFGLGSREKFLPPDYLFGSREQRIWLLRGLMDTDGHRRVHSGEFYTSSKQLAEDVCQLVRSLGGTTKIKTKRPPRGTRYLPSYRLSVNTPDCPFHIQRHAAGWRAANRSRVRSIVSVEPVRHAPVRCIKVEAEDSLYVADQYIVTHNTAGLATQLPEFYPEHFERNGDDGGLIFVVHRREIVRSTAETFKAFYPDAWVGIEMGELHHAVGDEDIIVVSVDSLGRLMSNRVFKYRHRRPGIIIFDEAHHLTMDGTWDNIATFFGVGSDPATRFTLKSGVRPLAALLTATPDRHDGQSLAPFIDKIDGIYQPVVRYDYQWGVKNGWLCDIMAFQMTATGQERDLDVLLRAVRDYGKGHQTLVFAPSVTDSAELAATLNARGIARAAHVDANTDPDFRREVFDGFKSGAYNVLSNFAVFTEGADLPTTSLIVDASPTESRPLFAQKIGRGSRPHPDARVDDYATAEERIAAIARSPKPYSIYLSTIDPTRHSLSVYSVLTGDDRPIHQEGALVITEIVDRIQLFEDQMPAVPVRDIRSLDDIEIQLREANVWTRTVYNERLQALSPLTWVAIGETLALYVPTNPWATRRDDKMPCVVSFSPVREEGAVTGWRKTITRSGGFNSLLRVPLKKKELQTSIVENLQREVSAVDAYIKAKSVRDYGRLVRRPHEEPSAEQLRYLKNAQIKYNADGLTAATADLLISAHRCNRILME